MDSRITTNLGICNGRTVIAGIRILVQTVMEFLGAGDFIEDALKKYPFLTRENIYTCMHFADKLMANHYKLRKIA
jgi:uncharacterized protein (DUF433 family)